MEKEFTVNLIAKKGMHTLQRITSLFSKKQCPITSLFFKEREIDTVIEITALGDEKLQSHILKKLNNLYEMEEILNLEGLSVSEKNVC